MSDLGSRLETAARDAVTEVSVFVLGEIQVRAPVDTGRLRASYNVRRIGDREASIGTNLEYAVFQEYGTRFQQAQPHVRPAVDENRRAISGIVRKHVHKALTRGK